MESRHVILVGIILVMGLMFLTLILTEKTTGLVFDESPYYKTSKRFLQWLDYLKSSLSSGNLGSSFSQPVINKYFGMRDNHPPLVKYYYVFLATLFKGYLDYIRAARVGIMLLYCFLCLRLFLFTMNNWGLLTGAMAAYLFFTMPRVFGHAHLATLDMAITFMIFFVITEFFNAVKRNKNGVKPGILFGLALSTKINAVFIPLILGTWIVVKKQWHLAKKLLVMGVTGIVIFFVIWPVFYHDPLKNLLKFYHYMTRHPQVGTYYMGKLYSRQNFTPWHYPLVMTGITLPIMTIFLIIAGTIKSVLDRKPAQLCVLFSVIVPLVVISLPSVPMYSGVRLFLPVFPFLALLGAIGFRWLMDLIKSLTVNTKFLNHKVVTTLLISLIFIPNMYSLISAHPFFLSYFNIIIGGPKGAWEKGFELTYWGETMQGIFPYLNKFAPRNSVLEVRSGRLGLYRAIISNEEKTPRWSRYFYDGYDPHYLRQDIKIKGTMVATLKLNDNKPVVPPPDYVLINFYIGWWKKDEWIIVNNNEPLFTVKYKNVPVAMLFPGDVIYTPQQAVNNTNN